MKSYFLAPIHSRDAATAALDAIMPRGSADTWLLKDSDDDAVAYISLAEVDTVTGELSIQADVSGRHYRQDADVVSILERLRATLGGEITNDQ